MIKLKTIGLVAIAIAAAGCFAPQAHAQEAPEPLTEAITKALFNQSGDIYRNAGIDRQATFLFGLSYPEHEYLNDAQSVNKIVKDVFRQRASEPIRTTDLPNPFTSSLLTNPPRLGAGRN
jgi:hypothetical protein